MKIKIEIDKFILHSMANRLTSRAGRAFSFSTKEYVEFKKTIGEEILRQAKNQSPIDGFSPKLLQIDFFYEIPKGKKKTIKYGDLRTSRPDIDNLLKGMIDAISSALCFDDSLIAVIITKKLYSDSKRVEFELLDIEGQK